MQLESRPLTRKDLFFFFLLPSEKRGADYTAGACCAPDVTAACPGKGGPKSKGAWRPAPPWVCCPGVLPATDGEQERARSSHCYVCRAKVFLNLPSPVAPPPALGRVVRGRLAPNTTPFPTPTPSVADCRHRETEARGPSDDSSVWGLANTALTPCFLHPALPGHHGHGELQEVPHRAPQPSPALPRPLNRGCFHGQGHARLCWQAHESNSLPKQAAGPFAELPATSL